MMEPETFGWISILPPLIAVILALFTGRIIPSLVVAIFSGGMLLGVSGDGHFFLGLMKGLGFPFIYLWKSLSDTVNLQILAFVSLVMGMIALVLVSGGIQAILRKLAKWARGRRSTQGVTALMGLVVFIDDYANTMIVGSAMRPIADERRVSREKLAFLVDATSAPIAGIAVVSTWIGYEVGLFSQAAQTLGISKDGYSIFFDALSFRFYCFLMIAFVLINVLTGKDFGPMARAEERAITTGQASDPDAKPMTSRAFSHIAPDPLATERALSALLPIGALFSFLLIGLWWDGGGFEKGIGAIVSLSSWREVISSAENNILILALAAGLGVLLASLCARFVSGLPSRSVVRALGSGLRGSLLPIVILVLAWSLKASCDGLGTGVFLAKIAGGVVSPLWFPALLFLVAGAMGFATGTSWGTMAILIPTVGPLALGLDGGEYGLVTMMSFAAILDGAIFGDHCSPISDTTLMSSIATSCDHVAHVKTQLPYSVFVAVVAVCLGYLPAALGFPLFGTLLLGIALIFVGQNLGARLWGVRCEAAAEEVEGAGAIR